MSWRVDPPNKTHDVQRGGAIDDDHELSTWEADFRSAAQQDDCALLRGHLRKYGLGDDAEQLLEGTVDFVAMCVAYATMDGQSPLDFLARQSYEPSDAGDATYILTFDLCRKGFARVVTGSHVGVVDFADLYEVPWHRYQVVGYCSILISRVDGAALTAEELDYLEEVITEDLRYDYGEDELDFWFDPDTVNGALVVAVQDAFEVDGTD